MLSFFVRRLMGLGVDTFLAGLLLYTFLVVPFVPIVCSMPTPQIFGGDWKRREEQRANYIQVFGGLYSLDKPWPLSYLDWLFYPEGSTALFLDNYSTGELKAVPVVHSSLLSGDFGMSWDKDHYSPVLSMYGINLSVLLGMSAGLLLCAAGALAWKRRGRKPVWGHSIATNPGRAVWRRTELWPIT